MTVWGWVRCEGPGCFSGTGKARKDCLICGGDAWVRKGTTEASEAVDDKRDETFQHKWRYYCTSVEPAVVKNFWMCAKCGQTTVGGFPTIDGCDTADEDDPELSMEQLYKNTWD